MDPLVILLLLVMLAIGLGLGWLVGSGRAAALAEERGRACEQLRSELAAAAAERDGARQDLAGLQAEREERDAVEGAPPAGRGDAEAL